MIRWWNGLTLLQQIFALLAVPATLVMLLQSLILLLGVGFGGEADEGDLDADDFSDGDAGDGLTLFTVRGIVAFFSVGGWTGLVCSTSGLGTLPSVIIAFAAGTAALWGIAYLLKYSLRLQYQGNLNVENAVGKTGTVYLPVPAGRGGIGKVTVLFQERLTELDAVSDENRVLKTGETVRVLDTVDEHTILVAAVSELPPEENNTERGGISKWIR